MNSKGRSEPARSGVVGTHTLPRRIREDTQRMTDSRAGLRSAANRKGIEAMVISGIVGIQGARCMSTLLKAGRVDLSKLALEGSSQRRYRCMSLQFSQTKS